MTRFRVFGAAVATLFCLGGCNPFDVDYAIHAHFPDHVQRVRDIADCESNWRADAVSPGGGNHGVMQINGVHRRQFEAVTGQPFFDAVYIPWFNLQYSRWLFDQQGFDPWSCA